MRAIRWSMCLGIFFGMMTGCASPEGFDITVIDCKVTPGDSFLYSCEDGTYRCDTPLGQPKYVNCRLDKNVYCVEACK